MDRAMSTAAIFKVITCVGTGDDLESVASSAVAQTIKQSLVLYLSSMLHLFVSCFKILI